VTLLVKFRWILLPVALAALSCSNSTTVVPNCADEHGITSAAGMNHDAQSNLWGFYSCSIDAEDRNVSVSYNRQAASTLNIVTFLNANPPLLDLSINELVMGTGFYDVDLDISITHPLADAPQFNAYDVRGVFIGNAGAYAFADMLGMPKYPHFPATYQFNQSPDFPGSHEMLDDPGGDGGGPDGYTRWYCPADFPVPGVYGYTEGVYASDIFSDPQYHWTADLNPYSFFADGLSAHQDLGEWLDDHPGTTRVFSSGATNTRNYYIRFPSGCQDFAYAVLANWTDPVTHPSNMREAVACEKIYGTVHPDFHVFDFKVYDPLSDVNGSGWMDDYTINLIEVGENFSGGTIYTGEQLVPTEYDDYWCWYHFEIPTEIMPVSQYAFDFWVILSYPGYGYGNPKNVPNDLSDETLAAWFCFDLDHSDENWE
jgi:hypothetical protein